METFRCVLEANLPLYDSLVSEVEPGKRSQSVLEKTESGVRIKISADDVSGLTASVNYWLRLIKASSTVHQVI